MLKLAGLTGVVIIGTLVGLLFSSAMRQRQKRLGAVCLFIEELSDCIRRGMELGTILSEKGRARASITHDAKENAEKLLVAYQQILDVK